MSRAWSAEWFWVRRRLAIRLGLVAAVLVAVALPGARWASTGSDLNAAIVAAEREVIALAAAGAPGLAPADVFIEPRYPLAEQLPLDLGGAALALALIGLVSSALSVGTEWRTGTVSLSFAEPSARVAPALARVLMWWLCWCGVALAALAVAAGGLLAVGARGGLTEGMTVPAVAWVMLRAVVLAGSGGLLGAALASTFRSGTAVVVLLLVYVLVAEIVLVGLHAAAGYSSPGTSLLNWVVSADGPTAPFACGGAPRCLGELPTVTSGPVGAWVTAAVVAGVLVALAGLSARRSVWR